MAANLAGIPALTVSLEDEELSGAPGGPVAPPDPPDPADPAVVTQPNFVTAYSGTTSPTLPLSGSPLGTRFTWTKGTWEADGRREPTPGDQAKLTFSRAGATHVWYAGRIDGSDRGEMNQDDDAYDGVRNNVGSGYLNSPAMMNAVIITADTRLNSGSFDPAVFPPGSPILPSGDGPHRHSMAQQAKAYWTDATLTGEGTVRGDGEVELSRSWLKTVTDTSYGGFGFQTSLMPYWPTFRYPIKNLERAHSGYIGRPRGVAGIPNAQLPVYQGNVIPFPYGLRMATFKTGYFKPAGAVDWEFVAAFPMCWNGTDLWLSGSAHMAFLNSDGTPPATHPFVLPMFHWFASISNSASLTLTQMKNIQSAQATNANPAIIIDGQRRDFWNYSNDYVATHMEMLVAMDPVCSEACAWMVNNYVGLGRVNQRGDLGNV